MSFLLALQDWKCDGQAILHQLIFLVYSRFNQSSVVQNFVHQQYELEDCNTISIFIP
jgi:hypothetical protein